MKIKWNPLFIIFTISILWFIWFVYMLHRLNYGHNDFSISRLGVFGDSFGALGSLFSSLALIYTAITNESQRKQFDVLLDDRKLQYQKQIYDLLFLESKAVYGYYVIEHEMLSFFSQALINGQSDYFILRQEKFDSIELEASIDALLLAVDLAFSYESKGLIDKGGHIYYRIHNVISNPQIISYLHALERYNEARGNPNFPFPNLLIYLKAKGYGPNA